MPLADAEGSDGTDDADADADGDVVPALPALAVGAVTLGGVGGAGVGVTFGFGASPKRCGAFHMTMPSPHTLTSISMTTKTAIFCRVDGPRLRTTTVGLLGRRGRSGMRIVSAICPGLGRPARPGGTGNGIGVLTADMDGAAGMPPSGEWIGGCARCGPDECWCMFGGGSGADGGSASSPATMTAGAVRSTSMCSR